MLASTGITDPNTLTTTTTLRFSHEFLDYLRTTWSVFGPMGTTSWGWLEEQAGVIGGASSTRRSPEKITDDVVKEILSTFANSNNIPGVEIIKPLSIVLGVVNLGSITTYGQMDQIVKGFFQQNNIPTSHTVVTHNGQYDTTAAALLSAQMSAAYLFIRENAWYFLDSSWAGNTLHAMDQALLSPSRRWPFSDHSVDGFASSFRLYLDGRSLQGDFRMNAGININEKVAGLRSFLDDFEMRANFINTMFMATIAHATCNVVSNIPAVPPTLVNTSNQLNQQTQQLHQSLQQAHETARSDLMAAWRHYRDVHNSLSPEQQQQVAHLTLGPARRDFEAAIQQYEKASRLNGRQPVLSRNLNTDWGNQIQPQPTSPVQQPGAGGSQNSNSGPGLDRPAKHELQ